MHIITKKRLLQAAERHPDAKGKIAFWHTVAKTAIWTNLVETRRSFPHADQVKVNSGRPVTIFNITQSYRLITAIHYDRKKVFILVFLTHAEYDKGRWRDNL
jgi:mRNA interferase HigB